MTARARQLPLPESMGASLHRSGVAALARCQAWIAGRLVALAWARSQRAGRGVMPWPWAGTQPVAKLEAPRQDTELVVLAGVSRRTLAYGPGHVDGTPLPGETGNAVIRGLRSTHFAFLRELRSGDPLVVHTVGGSKLQYVVSGIEVVRNKDVRVLLDAGDDRVTLVSGYPFDPGTPCGALRYVVVATRA